MSLVIGRSTWIAVDHPKSESVVEENSNLACGRPDRLLLTNPPCQTPIKCAERRVTSTYRGRCQPQKSAAARLDDRRVLDESSLPPDILLPGARQSHEVKFLAVGQARRSVPHSPTSLSTREEPRPWIWVRPVRQRMVRSSAFRGLSE